VENQRQNLILVVVLLGAGFLMLFSFLFVMLIAVVGVEMDFNLDKIDGAKVGVVEVAGVIEASDKVLKQLEDFAEDDDIKAIVLRVDSPGGSVGPSQEIYSEVMKLKEKKKIVASMGSLAASGGYYISAGASKIYANPGTITGSIGVIVQTTYLGELFKFLKMEAITYKSGKHKDMLSPMRKPTEEDSALTQGIVNDVYEQFLEAVASGRGLDKEEVRPYADGRILSGKQALDLKLVDQLGNLHDAAAGALELAGVEGKAHLVYPEREAMSYIEKMFESVARGLFKVVGKEGSDKVEYRFSG